MSSLRDQAWAAAASVTDPEIPVLSIADLGMLRAVEVAEDGHVTATIVPTYSGCPAMGVIELEIKTALAQAGFEEAEVCLIRSPPWTTAWITEQGREKLRAYGIAPPVEESNSKRSLFAEDVIACPQCGSERTEKISEFGSTACKALYRCLSCAEPFDYFKCI